MTDAWRTAEPATAEDAGAQPADVAAVPAATSVASTAESPQPASQPSSVAAEVGVEPPRRPDLVHVGRRTRWAMIAFFVAFATLVVMANTAKLYPVQGLRLATKFGMFSAPPRSQPIVVRGIPRRGARQPEVLVDPNTPSDSWVTRLRDARERKWHDNVARALGLQQNYLAYRCRAHGAEYRKVQLVAVADLALPEKIVVERNCPMPRPDQPRAAR
jgi:hypothetical protein